jgi:hypothetical protein
MSKPNPTSNTSIPSRARYETILQAIVDAKNFLAQARTLKKKDSDEAERYSKSAWQTLEWKYFNKNGLNPDMLDYAFTENIGGSRISHYGMLKKLTENLINAEGMLINQLFSAADFLEELQSTREIVRTQRTKILTLEESIQDLKEEIKSLERSSKLRDDGYAVRRTEPSKATLEQLDGLLKRKLGSQPAFSHSLTTSLNESNKRVRRSLSAAGSLAGRKKSQKKTTRKVDLKKIK